MTQNRPLPALLGTPRARSAKPCRGKPFDLLNEIGIGKSKKKSRIHSRTQDRAEMGRRTEVEHTWRRTTNTF
jgi:hypothetical protein